jgi:hypothetical protein
MNNCAVPAGSSSGFISVTNPFNDVEVGIVANIPPEGAHMDGVSDPSYPIGNNIAYRAGHRNPRIRLDTKERYRFELDIFRIRADTVFV